jgi:putative SOS response-associated peptidase YedK
MCNFLGVRVSKIELIKLQQIEKRLGVEAAMQELSLLHDGFTYSNLPILKKTVGKNDFEVVPAHWEFIAPWAKSWAAVKESRKKYNTLNAKGETILQSKMYKQAALSNRCLVVATHFYEWRHYKPIGAKKDIAYPYVISRNDADYFFMAGICQPWIDKDSGEVIDCFTIITTAANSFMSAIHNTKKRQPTILPSNLAWQWLMNEALTEDEITEIATYQLASHHFTAHTIAKDFKIQEDPTQFFEYEGLPPLSLS